MPEHKTEPVKEKAASQLVDGNRGGHLHAMERKHRHPITRQPVGKNWWQRGHRRLRQRPAGWLRQRYAEVGLDGGDRTGEIGDGRVN
jgi:hypothetical protein